LTTEYIYVFKQFIPAVSRTSVYVTSSHTQQYKVAATRFGLFLKPFVCFVWISEQTAILSHTELTADCISEMEWVYCAVRTESLSVTYLTLVFKALIQYLQSRRLNVDCLPQTGTHLTLFTDGIFTQPTDREEGSILSYL
jgi:hypothetical protein